MLFLPASLLALAVLKVSAGPIPLDSYSTDLDTPSNDQGSTCEPSSISDIFGASNAAQTSASAFCSRLLAPTATITVTLHPTGTSSVVAAVAHAITSAPSVHAANQPADIPCPGRARFLAPNDVSAACSCLVPSTGLPAYTITRTIIAGEPAPPPSGAAGQAVMDNRPLPPPEQFDVDLIADLKARKAFGRGALPVPKGSEAKGFGSRGLYMRGGRVEGAETD